MGKPMRRASQRGNRHASPTWLFRKPSEASQETAAEREERERKIAEHMATKGVKRLPCMYRPLP